MHHMHYCIVFSSANKNKQFSQWVVNILGDFLDIIQMTFGCDTLFFFHLSLVSNENILLLRQFNADAGDPTN